MFFPLAVAGAGILASFVGCSDESSCAADFSCPDKENGNFADPCSCRRFYICSSSGTATKTNCPTNLYWDDEKKICNYKSEVRKCGPVERKTKKESKKVKTLPKCDVDQCKLPYCFCSKNGDVGPNVTAIRPQIIVLTFDGAINTNNFNLYETVLNLKRRPEDDDDGCPGIMATFFIIHNYNDYRMTEHFYYKGHDIAVSSVTGQSLQFANESMWRHEMTTMRKLLNRFANVRTTDILGTRAPQLRPGRDEQFKALVEEGFLWDSSVSTKTGDANIWPYTLDYGIPHECKFDSCPTKAYPGMWELPVNSHHVQDQSGGSCSYLDQCVFAHFDQDDVFKWLKKDFNRFYETEKRAPYLLPFHTNWFTHPNQVKGLIKFIKWTLTLPDVHYLTATDLLLWMIEPTPEQLQTLKGQCKSLGREPLCQRPTTCELSHVNIDGITELRYMSTCNQCPDSYPWI